MFSFFPRYLFFSPIFVFFPFFSHKGLFHLETCCKTCRVSVCSGNLLQPEIVGASGKKRKVRLPVEDEDTEDGPEENPTPAKSGGIPSDIRCHDWY